MIDCMIVFLVLLIFTFVILLTLNIKKARNREATHVMTKKEKDERRLSGNQIALIIIIVLIGIVGHIFTMFVILIIGIIISLFESKGEFTTAYFKAFKILTIFYLAVLISFGLCLVAARSRYC
ncbi:MAG: hypothetical protein PHD15_04760 [Clostridia bacterium]|nr:hypothetical protein [Clostridia bacterium]MDD4387050.1 hypothetical protein [Clostridia bacterium]